GSIARVLAPSLTPDVGEIDDGSYWNFTANRPATAEEIAQTVSPLFRPFAYAQLGLNPHTGEPIRTFWDRVNAFGAFIMDGMAGGDLPQAVSGIRRSLATGRVGAAAAEGTADARGVLELTDEMSDAARVADAADAERALGTIGREAEMERAAKLGF